MPDLLRRASLFLRHCWQVRLLNTLEREMLAKLRQLAKRDRRTLSGTIEIALERLFIDEAFMLKVRDWPDAKVAKKAKRT